MPLNKIPLAHGCLRRRQDGCHPTDSTKPAGKALVGLRSKTSLGSCPLKSGGVYQYAAESALV